MALILPSEAYVFLNQNALKFIAELLGLIKP